MGLEMGADGVRLLPDGRPFVLRLTYASQGGPVQMHELVRDYWGAVGVRVDLREVSSDEYRATANANDADILSWKNDGVSAPAFSQDPRSAFPPFGDFFNPGPGIAWDEWKKTDGRVRSRAARRRAAPVGPGRTPDANPAGHAGIGCHRVRDCRNPSGPDDPHRHRGGHSRTLHAFEPVAKRAGPESQDLRLLLDLSVSSAAVVPGQLRPPHLGGARHAARPLFSCLTGAVSMAVFLIRRLLGMALTLLMVSFMVFLIMELPPGDYADRYAFRKFSGTGVAVTPADIQAIRVELGLDAPMLVRYADWIGGIVLRGDFGQAYSFLTSVNIVIGDKVWLTMGLLMVTLLLTYLIAIPIGLYAAVRRGSGADYGLTIFSYLGLALPNFLLALVLLYFANRWFGASIGGLFSDEYKDAPWSFAKLWDLVKHLWIPALVLGWSAIAYQLQTVRATMSDELGKLSVMAARARGLPRKPG